MNCPLCLSEGAISYSKDKIRSYFRCQNCSLVFVSRSELLSCALEKERYQAHKNSETDPEYEKYLDRIAQDLNQILMTPQKGLDFGCGKAKLLEKLLKSYGHQMNSFDLYFHPDQTVLSEIYDFIVMSEVIEHLREPHSLLKSLGRLIKEQGYLFIKTKLLPPSEKEFEQWFYKRDLTHVQFFSENSLFKVAEMIGAKDLRQIGEDLYSLGTIEEK